MNQEQSIALWRQGKDAWNAWAEDMLRQKAELEKADAQAELFWKLCDGVVRADIKGRNDATRQWIETPPSICPACASSRGRLRTQACSRPNIKENAHSRQEAMSHPLQAT